MTEDEEADEWLKEFEREQNEKLRSKCVGCSWRKGWWKGSRITHYVCSIHKHKVKDEWSESCANFKREYSDEILEGAA